jgi:hypothetical protein
MRLWRLGESEQLGNLPRRISSERLYDLGGTHKSSIGCVLLVDSILGLLSNSSEEVEVLGEGSEETELVRRCIQRL